MRRIDRVVLPTDIHVATQRHFLAIPFGQRGMPLVNASTARHDPAMCNLPSAHFANPHQALGEKLGTKAPDPTMAPQQAALKLRDQMVEQVKAMVKASLLKRQKEAAAVPVVAVPLVLTEVSV